MARRATIAIALVTIASDARADDPAPTTPAPTEPAPTTPAPTTPAPTAPAPTAPAPTTSPADRVVVIPAPPAKKSADDDGEAKLSLPTEADRKAWTRSGFRLALGLVYGELYGLRGAPSGHLIGPTIRIGLRLDEAWSVVASFQYAGASKTHGLSGLRFAGTIDPTWHATRHLSIAVGFGFGGIVEGRTGRMDVDPLPTTLDTSYTFPDASTPLPSCSGVGAAGLARAEWAYVLGPRSQTALSFEVLGQWTGCVADTGRVEDDTGQAIVRRQWWPHTGFTFGWSIAWR